MSSTTRECKINFKDVTLSATAKLPVSNFKRIHVGGFVKDGDVLVQIEKFCGGPRPKDAVNVEAFSVK